MSESRDFLTTGVAPRGQRCAPGIVPSAITLLEHSGNHPPCLPRQDVRGSTDDPGGAGPPPNRCPVEDR